MVINEALGHGLLTKEVPGTRSVVGNLGVIYEISLQQIMQLYFGLGASEKTQKIKSVKRILLINCGSVASVPDTHTDLR